MDATMNNGLIEEEGPQECINEDEEPDLEYYEFNDSGNEIDDDNFFVDKSAPECIAVGLGAMASELNDVEADVEDDEQYNPSSEELDIDYSSDEERKYKFPEFDPETEMRNPTFVVGKRFTNIEEFKTAIRNYSVKNRCDLRFKVNDKERAQVVCKEGCKWRIWASWNKKEGCVQIKSYSSSHTCSRDIRNRYCTYTYVAELYLERFKVDPDWKTKNFRKTVKDDLKLNITRVTAWRTRRYARLLIEGSDEHQFGLVRSYAAELLRANPGSTVIVASKDELFNGIYVCLAACKKGLLGGCRQLLGFDGCFLKGSFGGQLLSAVGIDANDCIYPVACDIVERENTSSWAWFLKHVGEDLGLHNGTDWTFMTDRQKGLQNVISDYFPDVEHRFCVRHMYKNFFNAGFKGKMLKDYLWRAALSTIVTDYNLYMEKIKEESEDAYKWLLKRPPTEWSKSHFCTKPKSDMVLNNLCECFNKMILEEREKCILTMLIDLHINCMKRIQARRDKMRKVNGLLCPKIQKKLAKSISMADNCEVDWNGGSQFYVSCPSGEFVVDMSNRTCGCRKWQLNGIPCSHACAAIRDRMKKPEDFVHDCYKVDTYLLCYDNLVNPINGKNPWPVVDAPKIKPPNWIVPKRGRKQTKRRRQAEEDVVSHNSGISKCKKKCSVQMTCSVCGLTGHNKRYHSRKDASDREWAENAVESPITLPNMSSNNTNRKAKLVPQRANNLRGNSSPISSSISGFEFMPTPGNIWSDLNLEH